LPLGEARHGSLSSEPDVGERKANCNRNRFLGSDFDDEDDPVGPVVSGGYML
jgi:hypothetical protein